GFRLAVHDIGKSHQVDAKNLEIKEPVHQSEEAPIQLILVTDEGHHHANREFSSNHIPSGQPYDQYPFQAIDQAARYPNVDVELLNADALVGDFREEVLP